MTTPLKRTQISYWPRRLWLLARDYVTEFPAIWSIVRAHDCERWGGHYWGEPEHGTFGFGRECSGCGTWQSVSETIATGSITSGMITVYPWQTTSTGNSFDA